MSEIKQSLADSVAPMLVVFSHGKESGPWGSKIKALAAVAVHDGYISLPEGKTDALLANICLYGTMPKKLDLALPYRHAHAPQPFAVHRPKLLAYEGFAEEPDWAAVFEAFFDGVAAHEQGAAIWQQALDESC